MIFMLFSQSEWALTIIRIMLGIIFIAHGTQKVFGFFGGSGLQGFVQWSVTIGIPSWLAYGAAFSELFAGIFLTFGFATEIGALLVIALMIGAIWFVHLKNGFFMQNGGYEYPLTLLICALALLIGGAGKLVLWHLNLFK